MLPKMSGLISRHFSKFMPGHPGVIVQNMPGAGSLRAANHIYVAAPKDGTALATFARNMPLMGVLGGNPNVQFDPRKYTWLGSPSSGGNDAYLLFARKDAAIKNAQDLLKKDMPPLVLGGTAEGATGNDITILLKDALGLNLMRITVDGEPIDDPGRSSADVQRCTDVASRARPQSGLRLVITLCMSTTESAPSSRWFAVAVRVTRVTI